MNITLVISSLNSGGAERVLSCLANHWSEQGHMVSLITFADSKSKPFYQLNQVIRLNQINQSCDEDLSFFRRTFNICKRIYYLRKAIFSSNPDIIISFLDVTNITVLLSILGTSIPTIVCERTNPCFHNLPSKIYNTLRDILYPKAKKVIFQTKSATKKFYKLKNIQIIPNFVIKPTLLKKPLPAAREGINIISAGRLDKFKSFDTLINAFHRVARDNKNITLTIYGEGSERQNLEKLIKDLNMEKRIFLPSITKDIFPVLLDADLFVFPSLYEGFPNALCEAMSVGLPVIASDCSGNVDIVRDKIDGRLFPARDVFALEKLIRELISDENQRKNLGLEAKNISSRFSQEKILKEWDSLLDI